MQEHKASFKGQHKQEKESKYARAHNITALTLRLRWTMKNELWGRIQDNVYAKTGLSFCLENMDQENLAGWTLIHPFPASASQQI